LEAIVPLFLSYRSHPHASGSKSRSNPRGTSPCLQLTIPPSLFFWTQIHLQATRSLLPVLRSASLLQTPTTCSKLGKLFRLTQIIHFTSSHDRLNTTCLFPLPSSTFARFLSSIAPSSANLAILFFGGPPAPLETISPTIPTKISDPKLTGICLFPVHFVSSLYLYPLSYTYQVINTSACTTEVEIFLFSSLPPTPGKRERELKEGIFCMIV